MRARGAAPAGRTRIDAKRPIRLVFLDGGGHIPGPMGKPRAGAVKGKRRHGGRGSRWTPPASGGELRSPSPHAVEFDGDDERYLEWLCAHPNGYVVNVRRSRSSAYVVLHRAACGWISRPVPRGGYTERGYVKYCAETEADAGLVPALCGRHQGSFSNRCGKCLRSE